MALKFVEGQYAQDRIPVLSNVYRIPERLKEINPNFFVMFNSATQKFEVHDAAQTMNTFACQLPFDELDARALEYVQKYSFVNLDKLAREVEEHNDRLDEQRKSAILDKAGYKTKQALKYLDQTSKTDQIPKELIEE